MRKSALYAILLATTCLSTAALGQGCGPTNPNCVVPLRPAGDNTNSAASTEFVQQAISGGGTGPYSPGQVLGNGTSGTTAPTPTQLPPIIDQSICATRGGILERSATGWACTTPGTSGLPYVSNGAAADPAYQALTNSGIASGTVLNSNLANTPGRTLKGNLSSSSIAPQDIPITQVAYSSVYAFGAAGSMNSTTGTIATSASTLTLGAAIDFANGQGIRIDHAGTTFATNPPTSATVSIVGSSGTTTYAYRIAAFDSAGGIGAAISSFSVTTGNATLNTSTYNSLSWSAPASGPTPGGYAIYGRIGASPVLIGTTFGTSFADQGQTAPVSPDWIPSTPPAAALADSLITTITAGGGSTTLTLAASAANNATAQPINHDDSAAISACLGSFNTTLGGTCYGSGQFPIGTAIAWPVTGSVGLVGTGRGWFAAGPPANVGHAGTQLIATQAIANVIGATSGAFTNGNRISGLTIAGQTLVPIPLEIDLWGSSYIDNIDINDAATGGAANFRLGKAGANPIENTIFVLRIDNPLLAHQQPNLPTYNFDIAATNNNILHVKAVNAKTANWHTTSGLSFDNTMTAPHGYNYDYTAVVAAAPVNNFLLEGTEDQIVSWEADGSSAANIQINGFSNVLSGGMSIFQSPLTAQIGLRFGTGTCLNSVINNQFLNSSASNTLVQAGSPCTGENIVWMNPNSTNNTVSGLTSDIAGHIRTGAGGAAAPTITAGCSGAGSSVRSDSTDFSGHFTSQTSSSSTCTITFSQSFLTTVPPKCVVSGETVAPTTVVPSASTLVVNFANTTNAVFDWICVGI